MPGWPSSTSSPAAYLNKQLQSLVRAGSWTPSRGRAAASIWRAGRKTSPSWTSSWPSRARTRPSAVTASWGTCPEPDTAGELRPDLPHFPDHAPGRARLAAGAGPPDIAGIADSMERRVPAGQGEGPATTSRRARLASRAGTARAWRSLQAQSLAMISASSLEMRGPGGLAGLEDFLVAQRHRADAGGEVGHERNAEDLHAGVPAGDGLQRGGHAHQVRADPLGVLHLGRGFVVRSGELGVDALVQRRDPLRGPGRGCGRSTGLSGPRRWRLPAGRWR